MARFGLFEAHLEEADLTDQLQRQTLRRQMRANPMFDAFSFLSEKEFFDTYRLNKPQASMLIHELEPLMSHGVRSTSIPVVSKVLTAIAFYASGSYQRMTGQSAQHSMAQPTVSNCIREVTGALNTSQIRQKYIKFPRTPMERNEIKRGFYDKFGIPGTIGCIDGTHIAIIRPVNHEEWYFNRKQYHSLNTQIICDSDLNVLSVDASHGGASHDSFIWESHPLRPYMEQLQQTESTWFLGDSGYSQRPWMMTPILDAAPNSPQEFYSQRQMTARNTVERTIGVLKARWRCLLAHRVLHYDPVTAGNITNACIVLHNIANSARLPVPELSEEELLQERDRQILTAVRDDDNASGTQSRNRLLIQGREARNALVSRIWRQREN